jgi:uncharacterized membrane protein YoaK (UPF0700 family)
MITKKQIQMSETFLNSAVLAVSGGFQDAYTYFTRDKVFSNAQTGNVVLMSQNFMTGNIVGGIKYLFPFLAFGLGVFVTEQINARYKMAKKIHWRQLVLLIEIIILTIVGFIPETFNMVATPSFKLSFLRLNIANTLAASVADRTAPTRKLSAIGNLNTK